MSAIDYLSNKFATTPSLMNFEWVPTVREGNTGVGATLESVLKIEENNSKLADENFVEYKARKATTTCKVTLFTMAPKSITGEHIVDMVGYRDSKGRLAFKQDSGGKSWGLDMKVDNDHLVLSQGGEELLYWDKNELTEKVMNKLPRLCLVQTDKKKIGGVDHFRYNSATLYTGFSMNNFLNEIGNNVSICFRAHRDIDGTIRDRGTAFRIRNHNFGSLYNESYTVSFDPNKTIDSELHRRIFK